MKCRIRGVQKDSCVNKWRRCELLLLSGARRSLSFDERESVGLAFVLCYLFLVLALVNEACRCDTQNLGQIEVFG